MSASIYLTNLPKNSTLPEYLEFNMSNSNCSVVLSALGFSPDFWDADSIPVQEFVDACKRFKTSEIASVVDTGKETVQSGNMIYCGRPEGYITNKVDCLLEAAEWGMAHGADAVSFG